MALRFQVCDAASGSLSMRWFMFRVFRYVLFVLAPIVALGCGSDPEPTGPKETLTEKEKQQVQDLNKQRQDEWSSTKVKNKK